MFQRTCREKVLYFRTFQDDTWRCTQKDRVFNVPAALVYHMFMDAGKTLNSIGVFCWASLVQIDVLPFTNTSHWYFKSLNTYNSISYWTNIIYLYIYILFRSCHHLVKWPSLHHCVFLKYTASIFWTFGIPSGSSLLNFSCNPRSVGLRVMDTFWPLSFVPCWKTFT